ncbi:hypothetical protein EGW08_006318 [Elysia chlorotica]|uniref:Protein kinase domain-containing protein n=1 Tax=Elysia chlorotica TaxID=188477 RepID=A0A3S0ZU55_ELYCH|nr:hypothetical protein EGW08_006318 [Elysia chlorotica]
MFKPTHYTTKFDTVDEEYLLAGKNLSELIMEVEEGEEDDADDNYLVPLQDNTTLSREFNIDLHQGARPKYVGNGGSSFDKDFDLGKLLPDPPDDICSSPTLDPSPESCCPSTVVCIFDESTPGRLECPTIETIRVEGGPDEIKNTLDYWKSRFQTLYYENAGPKFKFKAPQEQGSDSETQMPMDDDLKTGGYEMRDLDGKGKVFRVRKEDQIWVEKTIHLEDLSVEGVCACVILSKEEKAPKLFKIVFNNDRSVRITMEYIEGSTLKHVLRTWRPKAESDAAFLSHLMLHFLLSCFDTLKKCGVTHKDIRGCNVIVTPWPSLSFRIIDFDEEVARSHLPHRENLREDLEDIISLFFSLITGYKSDRTYIERKEKNQLGHEKECFPGAFRIIEQLEGTVNSQVAAEEFADTEHVIREVEELLLAGQELTRMKDFLSAKLFPKEKGRKEQPTSALDQHTVDESPANFEEMAVERVTRGLSHD